MRWAGPWCIAAPETLQGAPAAPPALPAPRPLLAAHLQATSAPALASPADSLTHGILVIRSFHLDTSAARRPRTSQPPISGDGGWRTRELIKLRSGSEGSDVTHAIVLSQACSAAWPRCVWGGAARAHVDIQGSDHPTAPPLAAFAKLRPSGPFTFRAVPLKRARTLLAASAPVKTRSKIKPTSSNPTPRLAGKPLIPQESASRTRGCSLLEAADRVLKRASHRPDPRHETS